MESIIYERAGLGDRTHDGKEIVNSKRLAFTLYIALTIMLFAGLFGGWFVLKGNNDIWPPTGTPPIGLGNMIPEDIAIILSTILLAVAMTSLKAGNSKKFSNLVLISAGISILFIFALAMEYWRLLAGGVTMSTVFGGLYFIITGTFVAHFIGGIIALFRFVKKASNKKPIADLKIGFTNTLNWHYLMLLLWACIVGLVYG
ncbi:MAG: cytochrome c oxidase subunit 3 [bacterium]